MWQDIAGGARTDSEHPGADLAPRLKHPGRAGSCQTVPMDTGWMGSHISVSPSTHQFGWAGSGARSALGHSGEGYHETRCWVPSEGNQNRGFHTQTPGNCSRGLYPGWEGHNGGLPSLVHTHTEVFLGAQPLSHCLHWPRYTGKQNQLEVVREKEGSVQPGSSKVGLLWSERVRPHRASQARPAFNGSKTAAL